MSKLNKSYLQYFKRPFFISITNNLLKICLCGFNSTKIFIFDNKNNLINFINIEDLNIKTISHIYFIEKNNKFLIVDKINNIIYLFDINFKYICDNKNYDIDAVYFDKEKYLYVYSSIKKLLYAIDCTKNLKNTDFFKFKNYEFLNKITSIFIIKKSLFLLNSNESQIYKFTKLKEKYVFASKGLKQGRKGFGYSRMPNHFIICERKIILCDTDNYKVQIFDLEINFLKEYFKKGTKINNLDYPLYLDYHRKLIYICDTNNDRVISYNLNKNKSNLIVSYYHINKSLRRPSSVLSDSKHYIYIADRSNNYIKIFDKNLNFVSKSIKLKQPSKIEFYNKGRNKYLIAMERNDYNETYISIFKIIYISGVKLLKVFSKHINFLKDPQDFKILKNHIVFIDTLNRRVVMTNMRGKLIKFTNLSAITKNQSILCKSIFILKNSKIFIGDFDNLCFYIFNNKLNFIKTIKSNLSRYKYKKLRSYYLDSSKEIFLTRNEKRLSVRYKNKKMVNINFLKQTNVPLNNPTEINYFNKKFYISDKENDRVIITDNKLKFISEIR